MVLDELAAFLHAEGVGILGTTLFKSAVPMDTPLMLVSDLLVALIEVPGLPVVRALSPRDARYEQPVVQILTRGAPQHYETARTKAQEAFLALDGLSNITLGTTPYLWVYALQNPRFLKVDDMQRPYIVFNVRCARDMVL